jgi:hypothetical protein
MKGAPLDELIRAADELRRTRGDPDVDPYSILASLPFPIYVTTDPSDLLSTALRSHGKNPRIGLCRWSGEADYPDLSPDLEGYRPDEANPLVYHLFGSLRYPDSVALTADDYQDFLIAVSTNRELIPPVVRRALSDSALLFLGFRIEQGEFRVVFRSLMQQEGRGRRKRYSHVAVQIDPEESTILEPDRARRYLQEYFGGVDVSLCWNTALAFAGELAEGWERYSR